MNRGDILKSDEEKMETSGNGDVYIERIVKRLFLLGMLGKREKV